MSLDIIQPLPADEEIRAKYPSNGEQLVPQHREEIAGVLRGDDRRKIVIVGPCSAWPREGVLEYAERLHRLHEDVRGRLLLVLRCYLQKPRTRDGWDGPLNRPDPRPTKHDPHGEADMQKGIEYCRHMMYEAGKFFPIADEILYTHNGPYFDDELSYGAIGARSSEDPDHRNIASALDFPIGIKHPTSGNIARGIDADVAAQQRRRFPFRGNEVQSSGNPYAHLILRGGDYTGPNYEGRFIDEATAGLERTGIVNPSIIVDASHDNTFIGEGNERKKDYRRQIDVVKHVLRGITNERDRYRRVVGVMMESYIVAGKRPISPDMDMTLGQSITDPCLGWEETEELLRYMADAVDSTW